jgi:uncharacterized protein YukE
MAGETSVDFAAMNSMASRLSQSSDVLDAVGTRSPGLPKAGEVSGIMGSAIAHLTESAGNVVLGLKGASEEVTQARQDYDGTDQSAAQSLRGY